MAILYTIDTGTTLATCGCGLGGQAGTLARRASIIRALRSQYTRSVLLDLGNMADTSASYQMVADVARALGYDALAPGPDDWTRCSELPILTATRHLPVVPLMPLSRHDPAPMVLSVRAGGTQVGLLGVDLPEGAGAKAPDVAELAAALRSARAQHDLMIVVSRLGVGADLSLMGAPALRGLVDLVIEAGSEARGPQLVHGDSTPIFVPRRRGRGVGEVRITPKAPGVSITHEWRPIAKDVHPDQEIHALVRRLLAASRPLGADDGAVRRLQVLYAPAQRCARCHQTESHQWGGTGHAAALETLRAEGRLRADCLRCHSEYFRRTLAFSELPAGDDGIQCATCHGDGLLHASTGDATQIVARVPEAVCVDCHDEEHSPDFAYGSYLVRVAHGGTQRSADRAADSLPSHR